MWCYRLEQRNKQQSTHMVTGDDYSEIEINKNNQTTATATASMQL